MLQSIRDNAKKLSVWIVILGMAAIFIVWGVNGELFSLRGINSGTAASVNGEKISWRNIDTVYQRILREQQNNQVNERQVKEQVRLALAQRLVLLQDAKKRGFGVSDEQIAEVIAGIPSFQIDGQFSNDQYLDLLSRNAYTDSSFRNELSQDILLGQLQQGIVQSLLNFKEDIDRAVELLDQTRDYGYLVIPAQKYMGKVTVSDSELKNYYETHKSTFVLPEQVALDYIQLSLEDLMKKVDLKPNDLENYYQEHALLYSTPEKVRARHILIPLPKTGSNKEKDKLAKEKAEALFAKIKQGADFASLAKAESSDTISAAQGGDLGWFAKGEMVPEFEKAAFDLKKPNDLAGPIRTNYGYHIIQLVERKSAEKRPFSEVKDLVEEQIRQERAKATFAQLKEKLEDLTKERGDSLKPLAEALNLKVENTGLFKKGSGTGIAESKEVVAHAFSDDILLTGKNSAPISINENKWVVIHLSKHQPAKQQTLAEVDAVVKSRLVQEKAVAQAKQAGEEIIQALQKGGNGSDLANKYQVKWIVKKNVGRSVEGGSDRQIATLAFKTSYPDEKTHKPTINSTVLPKGDFVVLSLLKVNPGDTTKVDDKTLNAYKQSLVEINSQLEYGLYTSHLLSSADVKFSEMK